MGNLMHCNFCQHPFSDDELVATDTAAICFKCLPAISDIGESRGFSVHAGVLVDAQVKKAQESASLPLGKKPRESSVKPDVNRILAQHNSTIVHPELPYPCFLILEETLNFGVDMGYSEFVGVVNRMDDNEFYKTVGKFVGAMPSDIVQLFDERAAEMHIKRPSEYDIDEQAEIENRRGLVNLFKGTEYRLIGYDYGKQIIHVELTLEAAKQFIKNHPKKAKKLTVRQDDSFIGASLGAVIDYAKSKASTGSE